MAISVSTAVMDWDRYNANELVVLLILADHADDNGGSIFPSKALIARKARISPRTVQRIMGDLKEDGTIIQVRPPCQHRPAEWRINLAFIRGDSLSPLSPDPGETECLPSEPPGETDQVPGETDQVARGDNCVSLTVKEPSIEPSSSAREANPKPEADNDDGADLAKWFVGERQRLWPNESGFSAPPMTLATQARQWLSAGLSAQLIREAVGPRMERAAHTGKSPSHSFQGFRFTLQDAVAAERGAVQTGVTKAPPVDLSAVPPAFVQAMKDWDAAGRKPEDKPNIADYRGGGASADQDVDDESQPP